MKITKSFIDKLTPPTKEQALYRDDLLKGFGVRITVSNVKAFFVEKRIKRKVKRITLGRYPELTVEQARNEAQKLLGKIATGIDPVAEKKEEKSRAITLTQVFDDYLKARKSLKATTILDYRRVLKQVVPDWLDKPLLSITKEMVAKRHIKYGERSKARSNLAMRLLRALFNFATGEYEDANGKSLILENPIKRLSHTRAWYRVERRQTIIKKHDLPLWYDGLMRYTNPAGEQQASLFKDYFLLILFTGLRRQEAITLQWSAVDLKAKTLTITDTKNHLSHTIPLSDFLCKLLENRKEHAINNYVFPSTESKQQHLVEPRKAMLQIRKLSAVDFTIHDLRRTFITVAESLDIPVYALKRLLNHKMTSDVTAGYVVIDVERLRKPMQQITDYLLKATGIKNSSLVPFKHNTKVV